MNVSNIVRIDDYKGNPRYYDFGTKNENITPQDIGKVVIECKHNPWFYFRELARVPVSGAGDVQFYLHRANHAAIWSFIHSLDFELVQPR